VKPFAEACGRARARKLGGGDLVWSRNTARAELAIVLEPEVSLRRALQMAPMLMVALGDCLGSLCPPKVAINHRWPGGVMLNGALAGEVKLAAAHAAMDDAPDWMVVGAELQLAAPSEERTDWSATSLAEEAGEGISRTDILQSVSAHFLTWLNIWQDEGFRPVHDQWLFRAEGREAPITLAYKGETLTGMVVGLDEEANLMLRLETGQVRSLSFLAAVDLIQKQPVPT
jgi:biotin-(acetyl-CoA carboxylase) ligase